MSVSILVDGRKLSLNPFMSTLTGNVVSAIARSLKAPDGKKIDFLMRGEELQLFVDDQEIPLSLGQARRIVGNVLRGLLSSLHGAETGTEFQFLCEP